MVWQRVEQKSWAMDWQSTDYPRSDEYSKGMATRRIEMTMQRLGRDEIRLDKQWHRCEK